MADISFEFRALGQLKPDPRNARKHPKSQLQALVKSIAARGFYNPVLIDPGGVIVAGHGRYLAARQAGLTDVPVIVIDGLSEAEIRALRIADNKLGQLSAWDTDLLRAELGALQIKGIDLDDTAFSIGEIDTLLTASVDPDDEAIPGLSPHPITKLSDLWLCGEHRICCGDLLNDQSLGTLMRGERAAAAFLDPPYNVKIQGHAGGNGRVKHAEFQYASGEMTSGQFTEFLRDSLSRAAAVSHEGAVHFVCMDHHHVGELTVAGDQSYGKRLNIAVWVKSNAGMGSLYRSGHELVFVYRVGEEPHRNNVELGKHGRNRTNVWEYASVNAFGSRQAELEWHSTVKPMGLVADAIQDVTKRGEIVLDTFLGSGTTLIAAEHTNRLAYGLEIEPGYVDVALERWTTMTGQDPILAETGETFDVVAARRRGHPPLPSLLQQEKISG